VGPMLLAVEIMTQAAWRSSSSSQVWARSK
jgi:hypothetical protein